MRAYATLVRRELGVFFVSWTGYVILAAVMFLIGFSFVLLLKSLKGDATALPLTQLFYEYLSFWFILIIVAPVITMRSFALEKSSGTYETLMTTPVEWINTKPGPNSAPRPMMQLQNIALSLLKRHSSGDRR